jgi:hypothetical protein
MASQRGQKKWRGMETSDRKPEIIELQQYTEGHRAGRETHAQSCGELQARHSICPCPADLFLFDWIRINSQSG